MSVHFHHAAAETVARVAPLMERGIAPGATAYAQLVLEAPLALAAGDRFVLRDAAASRTIGGGRIVDLQPPERRRRTPERLAELDALSAADDVRALAGYLAGPRGWCDAGAFFRDRASSAAAADRTCNALGLVMLDAGSVRAAMLPATWSAYATALEATLAAAHAEHPDRPGLGQEQLRLALTPRLPAAVFAAALRRLQADGRIRLDRSWARLPGHEVRFSDSEERLLARIRPLLAGAARFRPPRVRDIARSERVDEAAVRRLFKMAARRGDLDEIAPDHFFPATTVIEMADIARALAEAGDGAFTVTAFRDRLDNGRKVALQILEFFDRQGLTMRRGDVRRINPHRSEMFSAPPRAGSVKCTG
jgi:selenocysteine-specific elongation factor